MFFHDQLALCLGSILAELADRLWLPLLGHVDSSAAVELHFSSGRPREPEEMGLGELLLAGAFSAPALGVSRAPAEPDSPRGAPRLRRGCWSSVIA